MNITCSDKILLRVGRELGVEGFGPETSLCYRLYCVFPSPHQPPRYIVQTPTTSECELIGNWIVTAV